MRLVTRGDLDGLVSAVLITTMEDVESLALIHPQDITDNKFEVKEGDILANLPYHPNCAMWFDHHELTDSNRKPPPVFKGKHAILPSVARVVYEYYQSEKLKCFEPLIAETDRFDSAQLTIEDISDPRGAILLGFTIDPRTGFGLDGTFFVTLVDLLKAFDIEAVLRTAEVARRVKTYLENDFKFLQVLNDNSRIDNNVIITDFRNAFDVPIGNRFLVYTLYPECNVSVRVQWGPRKKFVAATIGHSILNRTCKTDIGRLCSDFGGGGHRGAGACTLDPASADDKLKEIIQRLKE
ncbi:MAG: exopolyphosphatase [Nitrospirota bacterium]